MLNSQRSRCFPPVGLSRQLQLFEELETVSFADHHLALRADYRPAFVAAWPDRDSQQAAGQAAAEPAVANPAGHHSQQLHHNPLEPVAQERPDLALEAHLAPACPCRPSETADSRRAAPAGKETVELPELDAGRPASDTGLADRAAERRWKRSTRQALRGAVGTIPLAFSCPVGAFLHVHRTAHCLCCLQS